MAEEDSLMGVYKVSPRTTVIGALIKWVCRFTELSMTTVKGSIGVDKLFPESGCFNRRGTGAPGRCHDSVGSCKTTKKGER